MDNFHPNKCDFCPDAFDCQENLSKHTEEVHKDDFIHCADCLEVFKSLKELFEHRNDFHEELGVYQCPISECSRTFVKLSEKKRHYRYVHEGFERSYYYNHFQCCLCERSFGTNEHLNRHVKSTHSSSDLLAMHPIPTPKKTPQISVFLLPKKDFVELQGSESME